MEEEERGNHKEELGLKYLSGNASSP